VDAGLTEVTFSIKGATAESHDRFTQTPGCFDWLQQGIADWCGRGLTGDGDILFSKSGIPELGEMTRGFHARGLERFNVWLFSANDQSDKDLASQMPKISEVIPAIAEAMARGLSTRPGFITSLHTSPCTVPWELSACRLHAADLGLVVANPGGYRFRLEESPIEGGHDLERCSSCTLPPRCCGIRKDYLAICGDSEFQPR
jgi:hypothetical protein